MIRRVWGGYQCCNFHFGPHVYCLHGVAHLRKIPHVSTTFGKKWIHGVSSIYTSGIHYVSDTPRVSSGYPMTMYPVYPYVSLCIPMYPYVSYVYVCRHRELWCLSCVAQLKFVSVHLFICSFDWIYDYLFNLYHELVKWIYLVKIESTNLHLICDVLFVLQVFNDRLTFFQPLTLVPATLWLLLPQH